MCADHYAWKSTVKMHLAHKASRIKV